MSESHDQPSQRPTVFGYALFVGMIALVMGIEFFLRRTDSVSNVIAKPRAVELPETTPSPSDDLELAVAKEADEYVKRLKSEAQAELRLAEKQKILSRIDSRWKKGDLEQHAAFLALDSVR